MRPTSQAPTVADAMFLSSDIAEVIAQIRSQHHAAFALAEELNTYANWKLSHIGASKSDLQQGVVAALLPRLLTAFQGCVLMAERGMSAEATLLARKVLEVAFRIVAISKSQDLARGYVRSDEVSRRNILKKLKSLKNLRHPQETANSIDLLYAETAAKVKDEAIHELNTRDYAERAEMLDYYNTAYAYFSQSAHANARDVEELIEEDVDGEPISIRYGPDPDSASNIISTAIEFVVLSMESALELLAHEVPVGLKILRRKMERLFFELDDASK